jgi:hypothetical protein
MREKIGEAVEDRPSLFIRSASVPITPIGAGTPLARGATRVPAQLIAQDVLRSFGNVKCVIT